MKTTYSLLVAGLSLASAVLAQDIPLIDLTRNEVASSKKKVEYFGAKKTYYQKQAAPQPKRITRPTIVQKEQVLDSSQRYSANTSRRLRLFLRELSILQKAAEQAGGKIKVSIEPVGITSEELVSHLANTKWFDISATEDTIVVRSKTEDPYMVRLREETNQLESKRQNLLTDIQTLQRMQKEWNERLVQPQSSPQSQPQNPGRYPSQEQAVSIAQAKTSQSKAVPLSRGQLIYSAPQRTSIPMGQNQIIIPGQQTSRAVAPVRRVPSTFSRPQPQAPASSYSQKKKASGRLSPLAMQSNMNQPDVSLRAPESLDSTVILSPQVPW